MQRYRYALPVIIVSLLFSLALLLRASHSVYAAPRVQSGRVAVKVTGACPDTLLAQAVPIIPNWYEVEATSSARLAGCAQVVTPIYDLGVFQAPVPQTDAGQVLAPNDPAFRDQWHLPRIQASAAWDKSRGDGAVIAVLDTGVDHNHPDLQGKLISRGKDFINTDDDASDDHGHGTHVAGIVAAATNNALGVAGVGYNARILPVKVLSASGSGDHATIAEGIAWAADQGAHIINLSLGSPYSSQTLQAAIEYAARTAVLTCAAGNDGASRPMYPAAYPGCLAVAATDRNDRLAPYSNFGASWVDVAAPGSAVLSLRRGGGYVAWDGTSMAAPNVAGVAALVMAGHRTWTRDMVRSAIELQSDRVLPGGAVAYGRVNAAQAVGSTPAPQPAPPTSTPRPATTPQPSGDYARQLVDLINGTRQQSGLAPLRYDSRLQDAADFHNRWMRDHGCFSHVCPGEPDVALRIRNAGYPVVSAGENIGKGYQTPLDILNGWLGSPGHRAALLNTVWPDIGCAYLRGPSGHASDSYWSCEFARSSDPQPRPTIGTTPLATATPRPIVYPTPRPPSPPAEYTMIIRFPYRGLTWAETNWLYQAFCIGWRAKGVTCSWVRE